MGKYRRDEDEADIWLREHDPYYTSPERNKKKRVDYPYETPEQERRRKRAEIPISNLNSSQKVLFKEVAGGYSEGGDFNL